MYYLVALEVKLKGIFVAAKSNFEEAEVLYEGITNRVACYFWQDINQNHTLLSGHYNLYTVANYQLPTKIINFGTDGISHVFLIESPIPDKDRAIQNFILDRKFQTTLFPIEDL